MAKNIKQTYKETDYELKRYYLDIFFDKLMIRGGKIIEALPSPALKPMIKNGKITVRVRRNWLPLILEVRTYA